MHSNRMNIAAATLLLILGIVSTGIVTSVYASSPQNKGPYNPTSPRVPENIQSNAPDSMTATSRSSTTLGPSQPHYFLQEEKTTTGTLASASSNGVFYHGGPTMHISISYAIFWLPGGNNFEQSSGTDSAYMSLINGFLNDTSGTSYYNILNQYPDNINGTPLDRSVLGGSYLDTTPYPVAGTEAHPLHDSDIQAEVTNAMKANNWVPGPNKIFHVFTGYGIESCYDTSNRECTFTVYCAYHSFFTQGSQSIIYSNMPDFNGVTGHCTPRGQSPPNHDYYADPEINILSHELFEAVSDPLLNAWTDSFGAEIGDKCSWNFGSVNPDGSNLVLNGHKYLVQLEWSNYNGCVLSYGPSHSVTITPSPGGNPFPSTYTFNITFASQGSSWWTTTAYTNGTVTIAIDQNTPIDITSKTVTASQTEKWCFDQNCTNVSFGSGDGTVTTYYYFDLLAQQVSVSTGAGTASLDFATGTILPDTLGFPQRLTIQLTQTSQTIWVQRGTTVSVTSPTNMGVDTRWVTRVSAWTISTDFQVPNPIVYYPQYLTTFQFTVRGGGSYSPPSVTYYDTGLPKTALAGTTVWADNAAAYYYQNQLPGSTPYERWSTIAPNGIVSSPGSGISVNYYHQYGVTASYQFTGGNSPTTPSLTGNVYGLSVPNNLSLQPSTIWLDAGSAYSLTNILESWAQERWYAAIANTGLVNSPMILSPTYTHQYFLSVIGALPGSAGQGWYDAGSDGSVTTPGVYEISSTSRIRLTSYSEDGGFPRTLSDLAFNKVGASFIMDGPHTVQFFSRLQYYLANTFQTDSIDSMTPSPTGDSWYYDGTSVDIVLNRNWDAIGNTRQSLVSYSIDNIAASVDRMSTSPTDIPTITMSTGHVLSEGFVTQYYISVQGATLSGSQTGDGWFDSGSRFTIQGTYNRVYTANMPYHAYAVPAGFQILANTTLSSVLWSSASNTLSFNANHVEATVYIPKELNLAPTKVSDDGNALVFAYSSSSELLGFKGSSSFQVSLSSTRAASSLLSNIPDWILYPASIAIAVGAILIIGLLLMKRQTRKTSP
ncbi:hypothetical protein E6H14_03380 [Candidatus Bathyarchaeota archaeon]|nr:MAG: hypothetical protein E6H14_03380 [Candidatus Bathyarchaeota archaeon]